MHIACEISCSIYRDDFIFGVTVKTSLTSTFIGLFCLNNDSLGFLFLSDHLLLCCTMLFVYYYSVTIFILYIYLCSKLVLFELSDNCEKVSVVVKSSCLGRMCPMQYVPNSTHTKKP